ncbi:MAG: GNAT family N-acetyltransferase, partial [Anaerolineae bacterium]
VNDRLKNELRAFLDGRVHPDFRRQRIGTFLFNWQQARAQQIFAAYADDRPRILRADFFDRAEDAAQLFEQHGFQYAWAEDTFSRSLQDLFPPPPLPPGFHFDSWREETAASFFAVYDDAFRTRPGFPGWTEDVWRPFYTNYDEFWPDWSLLLMAGDTAVAYAIVHLEPEGPWIVQMGVRQAYRRQGLASALIAELLGRFRAAGHETAWLGVNVNNPTARRAYERMGFGRVKRYTSYQKKL